VNKNKIFIYSLIFFGLISSCKKDFDETSLVESKKDEKVLIKLGNKLNNPFTTKNMKLAYKNLVANKVVNGVTTNTLSNDYG
jgi:hypothetical protein